MAIATHGRNIHFRSPPASFRWCLPHLHPGAFDAVKEVGGDPSHRPSMRAYRGLLDFSMAVSLGLITTRWLRRSGAGLRSIPTGLIPTDPRSHPVQPLNRPSSLSALAQDAKLSRNLAPRADKYPGKFPILDRGHACLTLRRLRSTFTFEKKGRLKSLLATRRVVSAVMAGPIASEAKQALLTRTERRQRWQSRTNRTSS